VASIVAIAMNVKARGRIRTLLDGLGSIAAEAGYVAIFLEPSGNLLFSYTSAARQSFQRHRLIRRADRANAEVPMCDKCVEIDERIEHYRSIATRVHDELTREGIAALIADLEAKKASFHRVGNK
jgi:hypothetical protein